MLQGWRVYASTAGERGTSRVVTTFWKWKTNLVALQKPSLQLTMKKYGPQDSSQAKEGAAQGALGRGWEKAGHGRCGSRVPPGAGLSLSPVCLSSLLRPLPRLLPCLEPGRHLGNWRQAFLLITAQEACGWSIMVWQKGAKLTQCALLNLYKAVRFPDSLWPLLPWRKVEL